MAAQIAQEELANDNAADNALLQFKNTQTEKLEDFEDRLAEKWTQVDEKIAYSNIFFTQEFSDAQRSLYGSTGLFERE